MFLEINKALRAVHENNALQLQGLKCDAQENLHFFGERWSPEVRQVVTSLVADIGGILNIHARYSKALPNSSVELNAFLSKYRKKFTGIWRGVSLNLKSVSDEEFEDFMRPKSEPEIDSSSVKFFVPNFSE